MIRNNTTPIIQWILALAFLFSISGITAQGFDIIHTIPSTDKAMGLTWDKEYLWVSDDMTRKYYQLETYLGTTIRTVDYHETVLFSQGMAFDGKYIWACGWEDPTGAGSKFIKIDTTNFEIVEAIDYPGGYNDNWPHGMTYAGSFLWVTNLKTATLDKINPGTGELVGTLPAVTSNTIGIAWDGQALWSNDPLTGLIYKQDPTTGELLGNISMPAANCRGMAWDTSYLWITSLNTQTIYRLEIGQLGIHEKRDQRFTIYPNPARESASITFSSFPTSHARITISNLSGNILFYSPLLSINRSSDNVTIDTRNFTAGVYLVRIETGGITSTRKLIIRR